MNRRVLTSEAEAERSAFYRDYAGSGCRCFISPPCSHCTHPGHPLCQAEDETAWTWVTWGDMLDDLTDDARAAVARAINKAAARHLAEMAAQRAAQAAQWGEHG